MKYTSSSLYIPCQTQSGPRVSAPPVDPVVPLSSPPGPYTYPGTVNTITNIKTRSGPRVSAPPVDPVVPLSSLPGPYTYPGTVSTITHIKTWPGPPYTYPGTVNTIITHIHSGPCQLPPLWNFCDRLLNLKCLKVLALIISVTLFCNTAIFNIQCIHKT